MSADYGEDCEARVSPPPHFRDYACANRGKYERDGHRVCGTHAKAYDRNPEGCAFAWHWKRAS